jgi:predicted phage terminase large subunit-like protein
MATRAPQAAKSPKGLKPQGKGKKEAPGSSDVGRNTTPAVGETQLRAEKMALFELIIERARRRLLDFTLFTCKGYRAGAFHKILCKELDQFLQDVVDKKSPRLILEAPPRHGKTELASRRFPSYVLGRYPDMKVIAASHTGSLSESINRDVQRIIDTSDYDLLFPKTRLAGMGSAGGHNFVRTSTEFEIVRHVGVYKNSGVDGDLTGRGGDILLLDDPVKDIQDAYSQTMRDRAWSWFQSTFYTRCEPGGGILVIMTRWHYDDIVGRLREMMKKGGEQWKILTFPAIAEEDDNFRKKGDALSPERFTLDQLEKIKIGTADDINDVGVGSLMWSALYQQNPMSSSDSKFKKENWKYLELPDDFYLRSPQDRKKFLRQVYGMTKLIQTWDTAIGGKKQNDFAARTTMAVIDKGFLALEIWKDRIKYPAMRRAIQMGYDAWLPDVVAVEGGGAQSGKAVVQDLEDTRLPMKETVTVQDKVLRADILSPTHEAHRCYLPTGQPWVSEFVDNCFKFPVLKNDDDVDSWMLAMEEAKDGAARSMNIQPSALATFAGARR